MDDNVRIEEIDSDGDEDAYYQDGLSFYPRRLGADADGGYGRRRRALEYDPYADDPESVDGTDYDLYADGDSTVAYAVQLAMKDKEEWLVDKALERIRRAQMVGKENVRLSRRELDALERKRMQTKPQRKSVTSKGPGRRNTQAESSRNVMPARPPPEPHNPGRSTGARPPSSSGHPPRSQQAMAMFRPPYPYNPDRYLPALENRPPSSSRNEALQRPLPDDPRWVPPYRTMPHYASYSVEGGPYLAYNPFDPRHPPPGHEMGYPPGVPAYGPGYRSVSDGRRSSSTSNSLSPRVAASDSVTEDSSEEESADSDEADVAERKEPPSARKRAAASRRGRQRAKR